MVVVEVTVISKQTIRSLVLAAVAPQAVPTPAIVLTPSRIAELPVFENDIVRIRPLLPDPTVVSVAAQVVGKLARVALTRLVPLPASRVSELIVTDPSAPELFLHVIAAVGTGLVGKVMVSSGFSVVVEPATV